MSREEEFKKRLIATFRDEAREHLEVMTNGLIDLERGLRPEEAAQLVETVFREVHSMKGAARAVNLTEIERVCQSVETVFSLLKRQEIPLIASLFDVLHKAFDTIGATIFGKSGEGTPETVTVNEVIDSLSRVISDNKTGTGEARTVYTPPPKRETEQQEEAIQPVAFKQQPAGDTVRISFEKLDSLLLKAEEMLNIKLATTQYFEDIEDLARAFDTWNKQWSKMYPIVSDIRRAVEKRTKQKHRRQSDIYNERLIEFSGWTFDYMKSLEHRLSDIKKTTDRNRYAASISVDNLLEDIKKALMLPFATLFEGFPKLVRDLSHDQQKQVELVIEGKDIEIDRRILEEMRNPFIHLLRNAVDHGIEKPAVRQKNGKPVRGRVILKVSRVEGSKVSITVSDDGAGIDVQTLKAIIARWGSYTEKELENLSEQEILSFIFQSGVSTSPIITDLSGRGLGLSIVREKVEAIGGHVVMETYPGVGTAFTITLPVTIATFRGVIATAGEREFVIPTTNVEMTLRIQHNLIKTVENKETIAVNKVTFPLFSLAEVLGLSDNSDSEKGEHIIVMILGAADKVMAFRVDTITNEQEIMVKTFNKQLSRVRNIAGATILGSGKVVPIINVTDLIKTAATAASPMMRERPAKKAEDKTKSILVVEDSITSRMLLKNILETSGYSVKTAVDGIDGFTTLRQGTFDLVVSDVDMPRMNGFDLTAKIRGDKKLSDVPVILVTALDSREDRERGIDVGANAYIVKSSFDQSNLLEVIKRLT